jgi:hypothetical protein
MADVVWLRNALDDHELAALDKITEAGGRPGGRLDWAQPEAAAALAPVTDRIRANALPGARLTRVVWFNKDASANWGVPWHQDRIIAVAARQELQGFTNWSQKAGIWHCEPPVEIFATMRFVRVHLDDCNAENGAMEIALGSERTGGVPESAAAETAAGFPSELCTAERGDIQILPMLVLHRSRPSQSATPRRALRLDFASQSLPPPLEWHAP